MQLGLTQAAKLTGKDPSTITRAVNSGKLSATQDADGNRMFDVAELERVYGRLRAPDEGGTGAPVVQSTAMHEALEEAADRERQLLRDQIRLLENQVEDLRGDRDKWQQQAGQITRLLTDERSATDKAREDAEALRQAAKEAEKAAQLAAAAKVRPAALSWLKRFYEMTRPGVG